MSKCIICGKELKEGEGNICEECWDKLRKKKKVVEKKRDSEKPENIKEVRKTKSSPAPQQFAGAPASTTNTDKLLINLEKLSGKLELLEGFRPQVNERLSRLSEEIGDLRRMILDRERSQRELEVDMDRFKAIMEEISPEKFSLKLEKITAGLDKSNARIERNEVLFNNVEKELQKIREAFSKIKSFENLVDISKKIKREVDLIENTKRYTDRLASKVETIFAELSDKTAELKKSLATVDKINELTQEIVKEQDKLRLRFDEEVLKQKDLEQVKKEVAEKVKEITLKELPTEISNRLGEVVQSVKSLEKSTLEGKQQSSKFKTELESLKKDVSSLNNEISKQIEKMNEFVKDNVASLNNEVSKQIEKMNESVKDKIEQLSHEVMSPEKLEEEKSNILKLLKKSREDYDTGAISERAYLEIERANKKRLNSINSILERLDKEMLYKNIKSVEKKYDFLSEKLGNFADKREIKETADQIKKIKERLISVKEIKEKQEPLEESVTILSDRISNFEKEYSNIKENLRELNSLTRKFSEIEVTEKSFNKLLEDYKSDLKEREIAESRVENKVSDLAGKLFLLEKGQHELRDFLSEIKENNEKLLESIKRLEKTKADVEDVKELNMFFENALKKNVDVVESLLEKIGV